MTRTTTPSLEPRGIGGCGLAGPVTVVGAGLAGLVCARALVDHGAVTNVFDKGRSAGGRATSRHERGSERIFDHGAQFFTARGAWLSRQVKSWEEDGVVARWSPGVQDAANGVSRPLETWWVGTPRMGALAAHLARDLDVKLGHTVTALARVDGRWALTIDAGQGTPPIVQHAGILVLAVPAAQCASLLASIATCELGREAASIRQTPCWAVMVAVRGAVPANADVIKDDAGPIAWAAREASKPGRSAPDGEELWTLHASEAWSAEHLEDSPQNVGDVLAKLFVIRYGGGAVTVVHVSAHRWRFARGSAEAPGPGALFDDALALAVCGDWLESPRLEGAMESGLRAAAWIVGNLGRSV